MRAMEAGLAIGIAGPLHEWHAPADHGRMKKAYAFVAASLGGIAAILLVVWLAGGFHRTALDANITLALVLGILFTCLLGVGLMALIFYSDRSGQDEQAHRFGEIDPGLQDDDGSDAEKGIPPRRDNG